MIPRDYQIEGARDGYLILKEHMIVYLAWEERTGKSLTAVLIAEMCKNVENVLIVTKKKALPGWEQLINEYHSIKKLHLTTYSSFNHENIKPDLIIFDEPHNYIAGYPTPSGTFLKAYKLAKRLPIILCSATPHAQGYQQLYHQFALSTWSPWIRYTNFYSWFETYGIPSSIYIAGRKTPQYTQTHVKLCTATTEHLFITKTRKELGFDWEPKDKIHWIELDPKTKELYNTLVKKKVVLIFGHTMLIDSVSKERFALHQLEGGTIKHTIKGLNSKGDPKDIEHFLLLDNCEKVNYILAKWGDTEDLVIFYNYKAELIKLEKYFKKAKILQATSFAEGVELAQYEHLVVYSQDYSTARHTQRRARQASKSRETEIKVHFLLVENGISEQVYQIVSVNKQNFVDSVYEEKYL